MRDGEYEFFPYVRMAFMSILVRKHLELNQVSVRARETPSNMGRNGIDLSRVVVRDGMVQDISVCKSCLKINKAVRESQSNDIFIITALITS